MQSRLAKSLMLATCVVALSTWSGAAHAEQFVVAQASYAHAADTTTDSHYRLQPTAATPANWEAPINYAEGSVHVRLEVKTKPSAAPTRFQVCFEMHQNYCCTAQAPAYTTPGVYEWDTQMKDMWRPGPVNFAQGIVKSALILKDTNNVKPAPENVGAETAALYMPSDVVVTVTVVAAGSTYQEPPAEPVGMGGAGGQASGGSAGTSSAGAPVNGGSSAVLGGNSGNGGGAGSAPAAGGGTASGAGGAASASGGAGSATPVPPSGASTDSSCTVPRATPSGRASWLVLVAGLLLLQRRRTPSPAMSSAEA